MQIERVWAMPHKWTFRVLPIAALLAEEIHDPMVWADSTAGECSPAGISNDWREAAPAQAHLDALVWASALPAAVLDGVLFDPPYSLEQAERRYGVPRTLWPKGTADFEHYWSQVMYALAKAVRPGGKLIRCGWTSAGFGKVRGCQLTRILLVCHGAAHPHDTIVTVETKG